MKMEAAMKPVISFMLLYFSYYYALRFIQSVFQEAIGNINSKAAKCIYLISTPAHELAHLLVAVLCLAKIEQVQLFPKGNRPGFVRPRIASSIPFVISIKEFLVAIAPVLINIPLFIFIESKLILKCKVSEIGMILSPRVMLSKEGIITLILFIILISGIAPSHEDFKGMLKGLIIFGVVIFALSYLTSKVVDINWINIDPILTILFYYLEIISLMIIINMIINYKSCIRITWNIIINALRHTFTRS